MKAWTLIIFSLASILCASAQQCGKDAGGALCPSCLCCSNYSYCGTTDEYCGAGCQSQCDLICAPPPPPPPPSPPPPPPPPYTPPPPPTPCGELTSLISRELFEQMLLHRNDERCHAVGFYTYDDFIAAAKSFEGFSQGDNEEICKREIAAFLGQTSHETTGGGGWPTAPDGPYAWGYCYKEEINKSDPHCDHREEWPCAAGKKYYGRGPIQISYNYNYGPAGKYLGVDLLNNPDLVASDGLISFETAFWFWMTPQSPKPSCHDVITENWTPSADDIKAGRLPGYGLCTNIINGGLECGGTGPDPRVEDRIGFYKRYCDLLGVSYGDKLDCYNMSPYNGIGLSLVHANKVLDPVM